METRRRRFHRGLMLAAMLAPATATATTAVAPRGDALLRQTMLDAHNQARARVGVPALRWDDALAADAAAYAAQLARAGSLRHAPRTGPAAAQGENLWIGSRGDWRYAEMIGDWTDEARRFVHRPWPAASRTGRWSDVSHYAQMVWRTTTAVGCAVATGARDDVLVCRYSPAGNLPGQAVF